MPDKWVCNQCVKPHNVSAKDTYQDPWRSTCPELQRQYGGERRSEVRWLYSYRHIQQALKFTRMGCHQSYLRKLMEPRKDGDGGTIVLWTIPKVVNNKFIVRSHFCIRTVSRLLHPCDITLLS